VEIRAVPEGVPFCMCFTRRFILLLSETATRNCTLTSFPSSFIWAQMGCTWDPSTTNCKLVESLCSWVENLVIPRVFPFACASPTIILLLPMTWNSKLHFTSFPSSFIWAQMDDVEPRTTNCKLVEVFAPGWEIRAVPRVFPFACASPTIIFAAF